MIRIPRLTQKDLEIFKGKKVLICGDIHPINLSRIFKILQIEVIGICVEGKSLQNTLKTKYLNLPSIKQEEIPNLIKQHDNLIIQTSTNDPEHISELKEKFEKLSALCSNLPSGEIVSSFSYLIVAKDLRSPLQYNIKKVSRKRFLTRKSTPELAHLFKQNYKNSIILCSATKTADHTIMYTLGDLNKSIKKGELDAEAFGFINLWHRPQYINKTNFENRLGKLKIVMGIRDPISQNVSHIYQWIAKGTIMSDCVFPAMENAPAKDRLKIVDEFEKLFKEKGDDFQALWDMYSSIYMNSGAGVPKNLDHVGFIQLYIPLVQANIIDILKHPFDKEKGYAIMKDGNTEVFIYQLEKLNSVIPELSEWVGVPFDKLVNGNEASNKWIGESYKQAQKEIVITREYFDKSFNEPYLKHFYNDKDIQKFKDKWETHVR